MPGATSGRLCPICDSPIEAGAKKCSFCGTDLTMFEEEAKSAKRQEGRLIREEYQPAAQAPAAAPPKDSTPRVEPVAAPSAAEEEAIYQCPACGKNVKESDNVCPHCGAIFSEEAQFECPACHTLVNADATKCPGCGAIFVEEEAAAQAAAPAAPAVEPKKAEPAQPPTPTLPATAKVGEDEEMKKIISRIKETREMEKEAPKKKPAKKGFGGLFKSILPRGEAAEKKEAPAKEAPKPPEKAPTPAEAVSAKKPTAPAEPTKVEPSAAPGAATVAQEPVQKRQWPTDPREQGKELARLVAEVRALLSIAMEHSIMIDETKALLDRAITAGRERQFILALDTIAEGQAKLNNQLREYVGANMASITEEIAVAKKLGGDTSRAEIFLKEASRVAEKADYQASLVFIDKVRNELAPVTGQYNELKNSLRKFERLVKDSRVIGIDNEPLKKDYDTAKAAFDALDFAKAEGIIKKKTAEILEQIPERMTKEIEKAKQLLIEAKMKTDVGMAPQISILKSAIRNLQDKKYLEALADLKTFKKEMKKLLSQSA
ncbi:MAG: zinc ribbon domain-containing protein [Thermoplasmata archaeon]